MIFTKTKKEITEVKWTSSEGTKHHIGALSWKEDGVQRMVAMSEGALINLYKRGANGQIDSSGKTIIEE